jgi:hypothetical protein
MRPAMLHLLLAAACGPEPIRPAADADGAPPADSPSDDPDQRGSAEVPDDGLQPTTCDPADPACVRLAPPFGDYQLFDLGAVPRVPERVGGVAVVPDDLDALLVGGQADTSEGAVFLVGVRRDSQGHISGFTGQVTRQCDAPYGDGGLVIHDEVLLVAGWPVDQIAQVPFGDTTPARVIDLAALGVASSVAGLAVVPAPHGARGRLKATAFAAGEWYELAWALDGRGTFDVTSSTQTATLPGGPTGFVYVPDGSPLFGAPAVLVSEYSAGEVATYEVDEGADPIVDTRRSFVVGLTGATGAAIDPSTGDFLFTTFGGGDRLVVVRGFEPLF